MTSASSIEEDFLLVEHMNQLGLEAMNECRTMEASLILRLTVCLWIMQTGKPARKEDIPQVDSQSLPFLPQKSSHEHEGSYQSRLPESQNSRPMTIKLRQAVQQYSHVYEKLPIPLFTKAFVIYPFDMPKNIVTALLWYNQGLCCHMHCLTQCRNGEALQEALHFYLHSYEMIQSDCAIFSEKEKWHDDKLPMVQKYVRLLAAAICHNMALIYQFEYENMFAAQSLRYQLKKWIHADTHCVDGAFFHVGLCLASYNDFCLAPAA